MSLVVNPYSYFTDTNGNALNGYLYVGEVGKNAENYPIAIFYDALFTTPAPNPLTISAGYIYNGGTIAQIYASVDYSIVVKKTDGSLVYSSLNETGMTNGAIANIDEMRYFVAPYNNYALNVLGYSEAGDGGGGLFYYDANSTEADNGGTIIEPTSGSGRWIRVYDFVKLEYFGVESPDYLLDSNWTWDSTIDKSTANLGTIIDPSVALDAQGTGSGLGCMVRQYSGAVNVKWFGAKGDGVTDDTSAIQNAINDNIDLVINDSVYIVSNLIITEKDNFKLSGTGTLKLKNNANTPVIKCTNCTNFIIDGLSFDGNKINQTYNGERNYYAGISITGASTLNYQIINNYVSNNMAGASILVITSASGNTNGYIANNRIYDAGLSPYLSDGMFVNSGWTTVENNEINGTTDYGIAGDYSEKLIIRNNKIYNTFVGIGVLGANFWDISDNIIDTSGIGIAVTLSGNSAIEPYLSFDVLIRNNTITNITRATSGTPNGDGITITTSASRVSIIGNNISNAFRGIGCDALNVICTNNNIYNTTDRGVFCSGAGSIIANNKSISTAGNYYGSMLDKTIIDTSVADRVSVTSFIGGWSNYGTPYENAGYYKNNGRVYLYGVVKGGTTALGQPFLVLPEGYRPLYTCRFIVPNGYDLTPTILQIDTDGNLIYLAGGGTQVHLYQISFIAQH